MTHLLPLSLQTTATIGALGMALMTIFLRLRAARKPVTIQKILIPPLGMSTGFCMFLFPFMRIPWTWALIALASGALLFAYPLIRTTKFERIGGDVYAKRSKSFVFILFALLAIRLCLHDYIQQYITLPQTGAFFFLLAFGMIVPWRLSMLRRFQALRDGQS